MNTLDIDLFENNQQVDTFKAFVIPRVGEIVFLNDSMYKVKQITYRVMGGDIDRVKMDVEVQPDISGIYKISAFHVTPKIGALYEDVLAVAPLMLGTTCMNDIMISLKPGGRATTDNPPSCQQSPVPISSIIGIDSSSKWILDGNTLTITSGDNTTTTYTTIETGAVLKLQRQESVDFLGNGHKTIHTYTMDLTRQ